MSRKSKRNRPDPQRSARDPGEAAQSGLFGRRAVLLGVIIALLLALVAGAVLYQRESTQPARSAFDRQAALASDHSPTLGDASARVHVVEFLDPACETCALFYPVVKELMAENPGRIRLSVRHVAFHDGSEYVVRLLEASRKQDKYWQTLEALFASQARWAPHHTVEPDLVWQAIAAAGLDVERAMADMKAADVTQRVEKDRSDAMALAVTATPEYFVNGRSLPSFGEDQLRSVVQEELQRAY
jgi:protein-disulfide isomerase